MCNIGWCIRCCACIWCTATVKEGCISHFQKKLKLSHICATAMPYKPSNLFSYDFLFPVWKLVCFLSSSQRSSNHSKSVLHGCISVLFNYMVHLQSSGILSTSGAYQVYRILLWPSYCYMHYVLVTAYIRLKRKCMPSFLVTLVV